MGCDLISCYYKLSVVTMDFSSVCRFCIDTNSLQPIFTNTCDLQELCSTVFTILGHKVDKDDGLPQCVCTKCITKLQDITQFIQQCSNVYTQLLEAKKQLKATKKNPNKRKRRRRQLVNKQNTELVKIKTEDDGLDEDDKPLKYLVKNSHYTDLTSDDVYEDETCESNALINQNEDGIDKESVELNESASDNLEIVQSEQLSENVPYIVDFKTKRVTCKVCFKDLSVRSIDAHMASRHPGADVRKVKCELCDRYVMKDKLKRHNSMMHGGENCFKCGYCKFKYENKEQLMTHVQTCTAKKKKRKVSETSRQLRECEVCHKVMQKGSLRLHCAVKHAGLGPVCEHCGRRFGNQHRLREHRRAKHGYAKLRCQHCDFQTAGVQLLRNHERRHRGEKPFACALCDARFHAAYLLAQHRHKHRTDKPVKCGQCGAAFKARGSLHAHTLTCHGRRRHQCAVCARAYSCRHYAVKHMRYVHRHRGPVPPLHTLPAPTTPPTHTYTEHSQQTPT